jgi:AraC family transcriptional regulator
MNIAVRRHQTRLTRVAAYIAEHLDEPLDLDRLANVAALSPHHFHRVYRTAWRETAAQTLSRLRLSRAALQLVASEAPMARIARQAGYGSLAAFSRAFAAAYGVTPSRFRVGSRHFSNPEPFPMSIAIAESQSLRIAAITHTGPHHAINPAFERLYAWAGPRGLVGGEARGVAVYLERMGSRPAAQLRSLAGVTVPKGVEGDGEVEVRELETGRCAQLTMLGPYTGLSAAYEALQAWLDANGERRAEAPSFEIYVNDPHTTRPEDLVTEILLPLAPR